jgi:bifunctional DNase/RNase
VTKKKIKKFRNLWIFLLFAILVGILIVFPFETRRAQLILFPELWTYGYEKVKVGAEVVDNEGIVTLTSGCYQIVAYTEASQAESIQNGLAGKIAFRPNAHDLIKATFNNLGIEVIMVKITELKNNTFFGKLIIRQNGKILSLDARPSDATAIAVRTNSPIYVKTELLKEVGKKIC